MTTIAAHIADFIQEFGDTTHKKPRIAIDSFEKIEKAGARARKMNPDAPDFRKPLVNTEIRSPVGFYFDPAKRIDLKDFDGLGW